MNPHWKNFLLSQNATFASATDINFPNALAAHHNSIYPIAHLAALTLGGADAAKLLQGQITCNVHDISESHSILGALCNPKGRVISTFLLIKSNAIFHLILPEELLLVVKKRLQMYVLRSAVTLTDNTDTLCLMGLSSTAPKTEPLFTTAQQDGIVSVKLSSTQNRYLVIADPDNAMALWSERVNGQGFLPEDSAQWRYLDILSGLPWLSAANSEEFIPQMLNLDELGGISYNKGCYTGQEIVARTHYLGKAKRALFLAECNTPVAPPPNTPLFDDSTDTKTVMGKVLQAGHGHDSALCKLLIVLQVVDSIPTNLKLNDPNQSAITLLTGPHS